MRVAVRTDANNTVGTGHLHRCLNIGRELVARGHEVTLLLGRNSWMSSTKQLDEMFDSYQLSDSVNSFTIGSSISATPLHEVMQDARSTSAYLQSKSIDWLIVDHYSLGDAWVDEVKMRGDCRVLAIDDLGRSWTKADLLLDSALNAGMFYSSFPKTGAGLFGPTYVPLNPAYKTPLITRKGDNEKNIITLFFGGADSPNATATTLKALSSLMRKDLVVCAVVGDLNPNKNSLKAEYDSPRVHFLEPADSLFEYLQASDGFLGGGGTTTWERLCLGVPSATISIAENQVQMSNDLAKAGCLIYLGGTTEVSDDTIRMTVGRLLDDHEFRRESSLQGRLLVDGFGSSRICEAMYPTDPKKITFRPVRPSDCLLLFRWVNDPGVRNSSLDSNSISWPTHTAWFENFLDHPGKRLFIAELNGMPVGQIRFEPSEDRLRLSYSVDSLFRGKGFGRRIVEVGVREVRRGVADPIVAEVRTENEPSLRVFRSLGFGESEPTANGVITFLLR